MTQYRFITEWTFDASPERVWQEIIDAASHPSWWSAWKRAELQQGGPLVSQRVANSAQGKLPYTLHFVTEVREADEYRRLVLRLEGALVGRGEWTFEPQGNGTKVRYLWEVGTSNPVLNTLSRFAPVKRLMAENHDYRGFQSN